MRERKVVAARKPKLTRAEKAAHNRAKLMRAAQEVIGDYGYAEASVARIVERAGLAQGTFYIYFESRQDLFDQLLPEVGDEALSSIRDAVSGAKNFAAVEERGLRAFFEFAVSNPAFFRIFSEAEIAAPEAHGKYIRKRTGRYLEAVTAAWKRGEIRGYTQRELGVLTQIMLASRAYLFQAYAKTSGGVKAPPAWVVDTYMKFLTRGIGGGKPASPPPAVRRRKRASPAG